MYDDIEEETPNDYEEKCIAFITFVFIIVVFIFSII